MTLSVLLEGGVTGGCSCPPRYVPSLPWLPGGRRCLGKFLTEGLSGFTSSRCFCDLVWFLVSQKALFLGSRCCFQALPCNHGAPGEGCGLFLGVCSDTVSAHVCPRSGRGGKGHVGWGVGWVSQALLWPSFEFRICPQWRHSLDLQSMVCFQPVVPEFMCP